MKKLFKNYAIAWLIGFAMFNAIIFVLPNIFAGYNKFGGAFWSSYIFMTLAFIGQLGCAFCAFKTESKERLFLNLPLITISYASLIISLILGTACFAIPDLPNWLGVIIAVLTLGFTAIAVIKASTAASIVEETEQKIKTRTAFIRSMTAEAEALMARAKTPEMRAEVKKVYEAIRYSDPMSTPELKSIEAVIAEHFEKLGVAVKVDDITVATDKAREICFLVVERNNKCLVLK